MLYSLPEQTVFEAKAKARRATAVLLAGLLATYAVLFSVFAFALCFAAGVISFVLLVFGSPELLLRLDSLLFQPVSLSWLIFATTVSGALLGLLHFRTARRRPLHDWLSKLNAQDADPKDEYHARFANVVREVEVATGVRRIRAVVLPTTGLNAFSLQDSKGRAAIGVTEGLLAKLDRAQLEAVVAHEGAHLVHEDSRVTTLACSLTSVFDPGRPSLALGRPRAVEDIEVETPEHVATETGAGFVHLLPLWFVGLISHLVMLAVATAISRSRELLADAHAVDMCKNPLALAEALYRISRGYRGNLDVEPGLAPLFLLNPRWTAIDEKDGLLAGLFSTHPPISERLDRLLDWAKSDISSARSSRDRQTAARNVPARKDDERFFALHEGEWRGPHTPAQLLTLGILGPQTWVSLDGQTGLLQACDHPVFLDLLQKQLRAKPGRGCCPRCHVSLLDTRYEGAPVLSCSFCRGNLLRPGILERILSRKETEFSAEEIEQTRFWREAQGDLDPMIPEFHGVRCPACRASMAMVFHSTITRVVIDRCTEPACRAIWCDGGELERIQILVEAARRKPAVCWA